MKILQVVPYFPPAYAFGGPAKVTCEISRELAKRNNEVVVYTSDAQDPKSRLRTYDNNINSEMRVHYFRNLSILSVNKFKLFITPQLISQVKKEVRKFDVIHLHEYRTFQNSVVAFYARKYGVPYVLQPHGSIPRIMGKKKLKYIYDVLVGTGLLKNASKVIALSRSEAQQCNDASVPRNKIAIVPNGIDLTEYSDLPAKGAFRKKFGITQDKRIILYLGRINKIKGIDFLVKAYACMAKKARYDNTTLVIAGPDDGYLGELEHLVNFSGLNNKLRLVGPLYDKDRLEAYVDADIFVLPSRYETFPNVLLEAYACSKPVIVSRTGSLQDLVLHGKTGFLFEKSNITLLAHYLEHVLDNSSEAKKMGYEARRFVESQFSLDTIVNRLELLYKEVIGNARKDNY